MTSKIEWCDTTWNPITGCSPISEGCENCYAKRMANRLRGRFGYPEDDPFKVTFHEKRLTEPIRWKNPGRIFVCSMGDLFHESVTGSQLNRIFMTMIRTKHIYILLTKRPERILETAYERFAEFHNIWLGVTAENQKRADERIPILLQIPAAVRFVSIEPMLGPITLNYLHTEYVEIDALNGTYGVIRPHKGQGGKIDWVIAGCESGPQRRSAKIEWFRDLKDQCVKAGIPFFLKQMEIEGKVYKMPCLDKEIWDQTPSILKR